MTWDVGQGRRPSRGDLLHPLMSGLWEREAKQLNKQKTFNTQTIVFGAFLVTIAFLLGGGFARVTGIPTSIRLNFGGANQSIGFTAVPLIIASIILGPWGGMAVGAIYDTLSYLLLTGGTWNPIFTLSEMMIGFLPGLIYRWFRQHPTHRKITLPISCGLVIYTILVIVVSSIMGKGESTAQQSVQMISFEGGLHIANGILLLAFLVFGAFSIMLLWFFAHKQKQEGLYSYERLYLVTFIGILSRSLISGWGLWLLHGKTIPLIFYWLPRFVTPMFLVPITAFVISSLGYVLKKYGK